MPGPPGGGTAMLVPMNASPARPAPAGAARRNRPRRPAMDRAGPDDAPGIVFLHGTRLTRAQWWPQLRRLAGAYRCVAVDLPGHGVLADRPFTIEAATDLVRAAIEAEIPSGRAVIVGLSLGGYVAIDTAEAYPEVVAGLVLAGCSGEAFGPMSWPYRFFRALPGACARAGPGPGQQGVLPAALPAPDRGAHHRGRLLAAGRCRGARPAHRAPLPRPPRPAVDARPRGQRVTRPGLRAGGRVLGGVLPARSPRRHPARHAPLEPGPPERLLPPRRRVREPGRTRSLTLTRPYPPRGVAER